ncbi:hypothetical protein [Candidatus Enterococcus ferrettii]|uniref:Uncharacterized protein n=1 Tax=Candidatus Enterococcus ferrettii TaxID=2815324 RepID=A0ABV0EJ71_9ENTE|nr:hypothetical protein [Enterococcus sp. 665A]MBO1338373.1 hypothetical protein [Enterococcus sp. 665A]
MLDVLGAIKNLSWNTEHHFLHIKNQHEFMRIWAVQFELGYTDFRTIQLALQLDQQTDLLKQFTQAYDAVYQYEYSFVKGGLDGFNQQFGDQIDQYDQAHQELLAVLQKIMKLQPQVTPENDLV